MTIQENACYYPLLGNAGHSFSSAWLKRAYQRAKDEAEEEGKSLADIVAKRYGVSLFFWSIYRVSSSNFVRVAI